MTKKRTTDVSRAEGDQRPALLEPPRVARHAPESPWLTSDQAVEYLGLASRRALYGLVNRGLIPAYKLGGHYYFRRDELDAVIALGRIGGAPVVSAVVSGSDNAHEEERRTSPWV